MFVLINIPYGSIWEESTAEVFDTYKDAHDTMRDEVRALVPKHFDDDYIDKELVGEWHAINTLCDDHADEWHIYEIPGLMAISASD